MTCDTYSYLPFGVLFVEFWYIDGWVFITDKKRPIAIKIGVI